MRLLNYVLEIVNGPMQFDRLEPMLQCVFMDAVAFCYRTFGKTLLITSIERPQSAGVHAHHRGVDADVCHGIIYEGGLHPDEARRVCAAINNAYQYDPARPQMHVCLYGELDPAGKHWDHLHFQVHPRTIVRGHG